ncbi:Putative negative regulator of RcsB-dependent stress response [Ectothiorhodospira mobilis]|uniref:Ancillary SecYEG translocon subunit n=1 Tax=Ectothiorhodospira mobilis TaxID=195064 RepID=A0A1I4QC29_ECTMO|nr:tetratricopeptide repeat protein [Ectothiorhodospira mobilis]SFM37597.1 Putative negative regulator of RcsB-dependent stress response [Ectothiorhodospira mobilis]
MSVTTDEERIESIQRWWQENGVAVIIGLLLGIALLVGWRLWSGYTENRVLQASDRYEALRDTAQSDPEAALEQARSLSEDASGTPYATLAALEWARLAADQGDLETAEAQLRRVMESAHHEDQAQLARLRLARVLLADDRPEEALTLLEAETPDAFLALARELRGDALLALGREAEARTAYDEAMMVAVRPSDYLMMKRDALGEPDPAGREAP